MLPEEVTKAIQMLEFLKVWMVVIQTQRSLITNNSDFSCFCRKKFFKVEAHQELSTFDYVSGAFEWTVDDIHRA